MLKKAKGILLEGTGLAMLVSSVLMQSNVQSKGVVVALAFSVSGVRIERLYWSDLLVWALSMRYVPS